MANAIVAAGGLWHLKQLIWSGGRPFFGCRIPIGATDESGAWHERQVSRGVSAVKPVCSLLGDIGAGFRPIAVKKTNMPRTA